MYIKRRSPLLELLTCIALGMAIPMAASAQASEVGVRRVLVIYSYSRHLPWETGVVKGIGEGIEAFGGGPRPVLFEENLDSDLVNASDAQAALAAGLAEKYRNVNLDAVITESQQAASLLLSNPGFFGDARRYVLHYAPSPALGPGTGRERRYSTASDLETAMRTIPMLLPSVRRIVVVADRSGIGLARSEQMRGMASVFAPTAIEIWDDYTQAELLARARALSADAAIFYLPVQRDRNGTALSAAAIATELSGAAPVPVFSHFDSLIGTGIVGGYSVSAVQLGRIIGQLAASGDAAAPASQAAYAASTMGYWFDARALERWHIDDKRLPPGARVLFQNRTLLDRYWPMLLAVLVLLVTETALVLGLARSSSQRKQAIALLDAERASLEVRIASRTEDLTKANAEMATLLRELQHRVKNSMAIIASLVGIESAKVSAPEAKASLETLGARVSALASLYDILYNTGGIGDIDLVDYIGRVVDSASESQGADARAIAVERTIAPATIDMKRAVSIGLIVNELVTDCLKHAFPGGRRGTITVRLTADSDDLTLEIADDGIGFPPGVDPAASGGFGLKLVELLAAQLRAEYTVETAGGARFRLRFPTGRQPEPRV